MGNLLGLSLAGLLLAGAAQPATAAGYDLVVLNGRVMDPETGLDAVRNLAIAEGRIVQVTVKPVHGRREIDARGLVVAPGFIDLHAHGHDPLSQRLHAQDGVTTAMELESGVYPIEPWYRKRTGASSINFGATVSHGAARAIALGSVQPDELSGEPEVDEGRLHDDAWRKAGATPAQRARMADLVSSQLSVGAIGVGYHIASTPGADTQELTEIFATAARAHAPNFIHIRSVGQVSPTQAVEEVIGISKATGATVHVVHMNSSGLWETRPALAKIDAAKGAGADVSTEAYPYTGAHTSFDDPRTLPENSADYRSGFGDLEFLLTGERLTAQTYAELKQRYPRGQLIAHVMKPDDVDYAIDHPGVMVASDGDLFEDGKGHPRGAGTFSRIFSHYVRERKSLTLMEAISKVSYLPARRLEPFVPEMKLRGRIREGAVADLTIFDAARIQDRATYADGAVPSEGIAYVLVSGQAVVDTYKFQEDRKPGRPIYGAGRPNDGR